MKVLICSLAFTLLCGGAYQADLGKRPKEEIIFEGVVMKIGPSPGFLSGPDLAYQLVKYRIQRIPKGDHSGKEIIVDHLIQVGNELKQLKVGDKVCVKVEKTTNIMSRWNDEVLRKSSDIVNVFYIEKTLIQSRCNLHR